MKLIPCLFTFALIGLGVSTVKAQHCAPIVESYLRRIALDKSSERDGFDLNVRYAKSGGRAMAAYQAYVVAYLEKNESQVPAPGSPDYLDKRIVKVLHTTAIKRGKHGGYDLNLHLDTNDLAKEIIALGRLTPEDPKQYGGYGFYKENFRIAIFIPFLEDKRYSVLDTLPDDKHECNYSKRQALLFQQLPYSFSIHFGIVKARRLKEGKFAIQVHQGKPFAAPRKD